MLSVFILQFEAHLFSHHVKKKKKHSSNFARFQSLNAPNFVFKIPLSMHRKHIYIVEGNVNNIKHFWRISLTTAQGVRSSSAKEI